MKYLQKQKCYRAKLVRIISKEILKNYLFIPYNKHLSDTLKNHLEYRLKLDLNFKTEVSTTVKEDKSIFGNVKFLNQFGEDTYCEFSLNSNPATV